MDIVERKLRNLIENNKKMLRLDRMKVKLSLIKKEKDMKEERMGNKRKIGEKKSDSVFLGIDMEFKIGNKGDMILRIIIDSIGEGRRKKNRRYNDDVESKKK